MADALQQILDRAPSALTGLGRRPRWLLIALAVVLPLALFLGSQSLWESPYVPLFASLTAEDAGAIVAQLKASKTPYRIGGAGDQILVPADKVNEIRLRTAVQGLPLGGGVGFEVFDKATFGISDFSQRVNYQRALQGELARTIGQLRGVSRARVHLVLPQPSLFTERERPASASVFLKLTAGARLRSEEVRGIVHLVASSVEGLTPDRITIVDTGGRVLAAATDAGVDDLSPRRLEIKVAVEEGLERRVQSLLDSALGPGQAVTRASAQVNFDRVERTEERFDPNPVTRQETRTAETSKGASSTPTIPTVAPVPGTPPPPSSTTSNEGNRESETVSYELSRIVARTLTTPGEIQRLSVAVLLNTASKVTQGPDKKETRESVPRSAEEIEKIRRIVMGAVGYTPARGDEVTVVELPFDTSVREREEALLEKGAPLVPGVSWASGQTIVLALAAVTATVLVLMVLIRRQSRQQALAEVARSLHSQETMAGTGAGDFGAAGFSAPEAPPAPVVPEELLRLGREREGLRQKAVGLASSEPEAAAQLIRAWMVKKKALQGVGADGG
jgi:flagellar M-ring protein FliF